jgi:hypothetical protein
LNHHVCIFGTHKTKDLVRIVVKEGADSYIISKAASINLLNRLKRDGFSSITTTDKQEKEKAFTK